MAIDKRKLITGECDGPCGKKFQERGAPPEGWAYFKILKPAVPNGVSPVIAIAFFCPDCRAMATTLLQEEGFKLQFANEQRNGERT